jgi:hypothetical protein
LIVSEGRLYIFSDEKKESVKSTSFELPPLESAIIPAANDRHQGTSTAAGSSPDDILQLHFEEDFSLYLRTAEKATWSDLLSCLGPVSSPLLLIQVF